MASLFRIPPSMDDKARMRCDGLMRLVENACSDMLISPNWALNMQIVDELNREQDLIVISEVVRIVRKKLGWTNTRVLAVALTLAEALVKNCGAAVHREVASDRFMAAMAKVARTHSFKTSRESMSIADKSLDLIQSWGEAFLPRRREFPRFVETYHELRAEGLPFSEQYQSDRPPVLDPGSGSLLDRSAAEKAQGEQSGAQPTAAAEASAVRAGSEDGKLEQGGEKDGSTGAPKLEALSVSDREIVATASSCAEMLDQVVKAAETRAEVRDSEITGDVVEQLKKVSPKLTAIIEAHGESDPALLGELFKVNDSVDNALRLYQDVTDGKVSVPVLPPSSFSAEITPVSNGIAGLSIKQAAGAKAAASKLKGNIPILARPPSGARGGGHAVPSQGKETSPVDLLSGFELSGGGETNGGGSEKGSENTAVSTPASLPAAAATDMFASFAVPPVVTPSTAASGMPATSAAQGAELQQPDAASAVEYGSSGPPAAVPSAVPASSADKAQHLLDNLGALYAVGGSAGGRTAGMNSLPALPAYTSGMGGAGMGGPGVGVMLFPNTGVGFQGQAGVVGSAEGVSDVGMGTAGSVEVSGYNSSPFNTINPLGTAQPQPQVYQQGMNMGMNNQGLAVGGQAIHQHGGGVYGLGAGQMMPPVAAGQPQMVEQQPAAGYVYPQGHAQQQEHQYPQHGQGF